MILGVSENLKRLDVYANGIELASIMGYDRKKGKRVLTYPQSKKVFVTSFKNPVLMTDTYKILKLKATLRDSLFSLYGNKPRIVEYDGVSVFWDGSHINVWCPSIDTILYAKALKKLRKNKFKKGVEIGCGSGFLSKYALSKFKELKDFLIIDINKYAVKCAKDNIKNKKAKFYVGNGIKKIKGKKFDLMLCNPPYVPRPKSIDDNPYEGISLLYHLVHEGQNYLNDGGVIITNVSNLCWNKVFNKKPKMKMTILESMEVPLKVNNILNNKKWLNYLIKNGLKKINKRGYEYWQKIHIIKLEK